MEQLEVQCPFCGAGVGESCVQNGEPYPPHRSRVILVQRINDAPTLRDQILREVAEITTEKARKVTAEVLPTATVNELRSEANSTADPEMPSADAVLHAGSVPPPGRFSVRTINEAYREQRDLGDDDLAARTRVNERLQAIYGEVPTEDEMNAAAARYEAKHSHKGHR